MTSATFPLSFRDASTRTLTGPVSPYFERFYRDRVRFRAGCRLRARALANLYAEWAEQVGAPALGRKELAQAMRRVGHRYYHSDGPMFADAVEASAVPGALDNFPPAPAKRSLHPLELDLLRQIDLTVAELGKLREMVVAP